MAMKIEKMLIQATTIENCGAIYGGDLNATWTA